MKLSKPESPEIFLTDVTLRDGLQAESKQISLNDKLKLYETLKACNYQRLEITSFVNPKWVPQFSDSEAFCQKIFEGKKPPETMAFVPNSKGCERLLPFAIPWISCFVAASESFNKKNVNQSISETLVELEKIVQKAQANQRKVRIYLSTVFGCPYEGAISDQVLEALFQRVAALGPDEIALSDTIGVALPPQIKRQVATLGNEYPLSKIALHLHNTYGFALVNLQAGYESGVRIFDGSSGGIGGCPYAKGATGNVASEDVAYFFFRQNALKQFPLPEISAVLSCLKTELNLSVHSSLNQILERGGSLYAIQ